MRKASRQRAIHFDGGCWWLRDPQDGVTARICGMIEKSGWKVSSLGRQMGVSRRTFERLVMESLGISAKLWLRRLRVVRAGHLLRDGRRIKDVALELGLSHPSSFTREFRRLMGVSPSEFQATEERQNALGPAQE